MGNEEVSCFTPNIGGKDTEITRTAKGLYRKVSPGFINKNDLKNNLLYSYQSVDSIKTTRINSTSLSSRLNKIILIQKFVRSFISRKKFHERIELLSNIIELDSPVNLVKDKNAEMTILSNNKGELLSKDLISKKKIIPYEETPYYRSIIKKYKKNKYLLYTPLIFIDKYKNNNLYKGTWTLEKVFHGYGTFYVSGNKYEGFWHFGKLNGDCRYFLQNNDYFIGNFKDGQADGKGKYYHNDGTIYEGEWKNDQPSGKGKELFVDGSMFEGIFENGVKQKGLFKWNDGSYYEGEIKNNVFEGKGTFHWKEGREYQGSWVGGKMWGEGVMKYLDGAKYVGKFVDGKREGYGKYIWNKNKYYEGEWKKGKQDGKGFFFTRGKGMHAIWKEGNIVRYLTNDNITTKDSTLNNSKINNRSRIISNNTNYNDSVLSINQSNNSGIDKMISRMRTVRNKYKNVNYKLNDITKKKTSDLTKIKKNNNNKLNNNKNKNNNNKSFQYNTSINTTINSINKKNYSTARSKNNKIKNPQKDDSKSISSRLYKYSNNSLIVDKEKGSSKIKTEAKILNQTQEITPSNRKKLSIKKK